MATCGICSRETCDVPVSRDPNVKYSQGDVYSLRESVYTPIYDILRRTFSELGGESDALKRNQHSFEDLTSIADVIKGGRPAVIMKDDDDNRLGLMVCVATTYSREDISKLPRIFRHFSIPIVPNHHISPGHLCHLHSLPEWDRENAWLIAWPFRSTATCEGIWTAHADGEEIPQVLGTDTMEFLRTEINRRREEWWEMCKDPEFAAALEAELRQHVEDRKKRFYGGGRSRISSFESVATGVDGPSWRSTMRSPTTIPEEPEDNVVPGKPGKPSEPWPWKITGKPRTGSTYSLASASGKRADADKHSIESTRSRTSLAQKPRNGSGLFNFDVLRTLKVTSG